jgi:NADH dehydrogenase
MKANLMALPPAAKIHREPHVVIIGGGFGGLNAARALRKAPVRVTLLDRRNHHLFQPLLYQVATAALNPSDIAAPLRRILRRQRNTEVFLAQVRAVDVANKCVVLDQGTFPYDKLIIATGATHSYFGHADWERLAPGLKSVEDAIEIRRRVLLAFEMAERETDERERRYWTTFVVVGGGPTGVELAGALAEISRTTLARDFRRIDPRHTHVILVEAGPRILPAYDPELSAAAVRQLEQLGVQVRQSAPVTAVDPGGVEIGGDRIEARTVLWAAGVAASPLAGTLGAPLDRQGRVKVTPFLTLPGNDDVYVVGDLAAAEQAPNTFVPGVAQGAIQGGRYAARRIVAQLRGEPCGPFKYRDKGSLATIGRAAAVAELGRAHFSGAIAWLLWLVVHIMFLVGFRNRVAVLLEWAWSYVTFERGARLITGPLPGPPRSAERGTTPAPEAPAPHAEAAAEARPPGNGGAAPAAWLSALSRRARRAPADRRSTRPRFRRAPPNGSAGAGWIESAWWHGGSARNRRTPRVRMRGTCAGVPKRHRSSRSLRRRAS